MTFESHSGLGRRGGAASMGPAGPGRDPARGGLGAGLNDFSYLKPLWPGSRVQTESDRAIGHGCQLVPRIRGPGRAGPGRAGPRSAAWSRPAPPVLAVALNRVTSHSLAPLLVKHDSFGVDSERHLTQAGKRSSYGRGGAATA